MDCILPKMDDLKLFIHNQKSKKTMYYANLDLQALIEELPQNRPLYKDSGLWQVRTDDMEDVLCQQTANETLSQFLVRYLEWHWEHGEQETDSNNFGGGYIGEDLSVCDAEEEQRKPATPPNERKFVRYDLNGQKVFEGDRVEWQLKGGIYLNKGRIAYDNEMCAFIMHSDRDVPQYLPLLCECIVFNLIPSEVKGGEK
jgi:hypothetical protein